MAKSLTETKRRSFKH